MATDSYKWLVPTSREGWIAHIRGIGRMMEMCGPESFARPVSHQLFIGFRPLVVRIKHIAQMARNQSVTSD